MDAKQKKKERQPRKGGVRTAWAEYPSITPYHRVGKLHPDDRKGPWVVLEKVHGANFCFITNGTETVTAKRSSVLPPEERFYHWQDVLNKYEPTIKSVYERVQGLPGFKDTTEVCVFGELYGGHYPHPDVPRKGVSSVQKGVYYSPDIDFCAFDIQVVRAGGHKKQWLNYLRATEIFDAVGLFHAPILMQGTLDECMQFNIRINSVIPAKLGLPDLEKNQIEGVVIKAIETVYFLPCVKNQLIRAIYKKKNDNFEEVNPRSQVEEWSSGATRSSKKRVLERKGALEQEMDRYVNLNRLHNLESKMGPVAFENEPEAAQALADDALKDFIADHPEDWASLDEKGKNLYSKRFKTRVATWLADQLRQPDGEMATSEANGA